MRNYYVYILASKRNGTLYTGMTSELVRRTHEHKEGITDGFSKEYGVKMLVHYEVFSDPENAIKREKRIKKWNREWTLNLIETSNPDWKDLYEEITR